MIIYKIENKINGKVYIGQTKNELTARICVHAKNKSYIGSALRKYGIQSFEVSVIDEADTKEVLNEKEKHWIKELNCLYPNGYNLSGGGEGTYDPTGQIGAKISVSLKKYIKTPEHCANISKANTGHINSEEQNRKISESCKGKNKGKKRPDLSERNRSNKGKPSSQKGKKKSKPPWNTGLTKETDERLKNFTGRPPGGVPWNKGLTMKTDSKIKNCSEKI